MKKSLKRVASLFGHLQRAIMSKKRSVQETPKGHEIPIPTRKEFEENLDKVAKPVKESPTHRPKKG